MSKLRQRGCSVFPVDIAKSRCKDDPILCVHRTYLCAPLDRLASYSLTHSLTHACMQTQDTKSNNSIKLFVYTRINNKESNKKALFSPHLQEKNESWRWAAKRTPTHIFHFCNFRFLPRVSAASTMSSAANQARQRRIAVLGARAVGKSVIYQARQAVRQS